MIKYKIRDLTFGLRYFAEGALFDTKEEVLNQLIDYHNTDFEDEEYDSLEDYLKKNNIDNLEAKLEEICSLYEWDIEDVECEKCLVCQAIYEIDEGHRCSKI